MLKTFVVLVLGVESRDGTRSWNSSINTNRIEENRAREQLDNFQNSNYQKFTWSL